MMALVEIVRGGARARAGHDPATGDVSVGFTFEPVVPMVFNDPWRIEAIARGATGG